MRSAKQLIPLLLAVATLQVVFRLWVPAGPDGVQRFWTLENQIDIVQQISVNAILAFGMTLTILIGGIDLSVGALLALVGSIAVSFLKMGDTRALSVGGWVLLPAGSQGWLAVGVLAALGAAAGLGFFNGLCAARTKMPPFIITLATMLVVRGAAYRFNEGRPMHVPDYATGYLSLGNGRLWGLIPLPVIVMSVIFVLAAFLLHRTRFGQHLYAMGGNREAARFTGIPLVRVEILVYVFCSAMALVAGMIHSSQLYAAEPESGKGFELDAIAAAVVGGTSFTGGKGTMIGALIGAVIIGILNKGLNQAGVHFSIQHVIKGLVILSAVYLDVRRRK